MMRTFAVLIVFVAVFISGCNDNSVNTTSGISYREILSASMSGYNVKLFITGGDSLTTGYNDIYFKVTKNSAELKTGYVKFYPVMWMTPHLWHGTPSTPAISYDNSTGYFKGNVVFNMATQPPGLVWRSVITYHDENGTDHVSDSIPTYTSYHQEKQWALISDSTEQTKYYISLIKPYTPQKQLNDFWAVIYKSDDFETTFEQLSDPLMMLSVFKSDSTNIHSTGNSNPAAGTDGIFKGKINLPYEGTWNVCDTVYYHGHYITNTPPPMPVFTFEIQ